MSGALPLPSRRAWIVFLFALFVALIALPVSAGWGLAHALSFGVFVVGFILLPGSACMSWADPERDALSALFLSAVTGLAVLTLVFVPLCMLDARELTWIVPVVALPVWIVARRSKRDVARRPPEWRDLVALSLPLVVVLLRADLERPADWFYGFEKDASFHVENAADLRWRWPMGDPRIAGELLRYHFFGYVPGAAASQVLGLSVRECMLGLGAHFSPMLFALGVFVCARALRAGPWLAGFAALGLVLHIDLGSDLGQLFGADLSTSSFFHVGLYQSVTTAQGLSVLLAVILLVHEHLRGAPRPRQRLILMAACVMLASGSKGSVLVPLVAGLTAALSWSCIARREFPARLGTVLAIVFACALPMSAWLVQGENSYAQSMFRWGPGIVQIQGGLERDIVHRCGGDPSHPGLLATILISPLWWGAFLGLGAIGLVAWLVTRTPTRETIEIVLASTCAAGIVPALLLEAPGLSQLFFAYDTQVCAILLGAAAVARWRERRPRWATAITSVGVACMLAQIAGVIRESNASNSRTACIMRGGLDEYRATLDWIRTQSPANAVMLVDDSRLAVGPLTERRAFFETSHFSPKKEAQVISDASPLGRPPDPFASRAQCQADFFVSPSRMALSRIRAEMGRTLPIFVLRSNIRVERHPGWYACDVDAVEDRDTFGQEIGAELVHDGVYAAVYRLPSAQD